MKNKTKNKLIRHLAHEVQPTRLRMLHQEYCESVGAPEDMIHEMGDFEAFCAGTPTLGVIAKLGDFLTTHDYFAVDSYGYFNTFDYLGSVNSPLDFGELADFLIETDHEILEELDD